MDDVRPVLFYGSEDGKYGVSLYPKMVVISIIIALVFASLPVASAFAAPAGSSGSTISDTLERDWQNKLRTLRYLGFFYTHIRLYPADFDKPSDLAQAHFYLEKYGIALRGANTVVFNHTGFDIKGQVLNERQADQSVRDLAMYLQMMRGLRENMGEIPSRSKGL